MEKFHRSILRIFRTGALALLAGTAALVIFIGGLALARSQPLALPAPGGPHRVGRAVFNWTDSARPDALADAANPPSRKLAVWLWYPADAARLPESSSSAPYLPPAWVEARDRDQSVGVLIERDLRKIETHSYEDAAPASAPAGFPVLVMLPGMGPSVADYTIFAEALASRGYIVAGINPTGTSNLSVFLDGATAPRTQRGSIPDSDNPEAADADGQRILAVWAQDAAFVMDQLAALNADAASPFYQHLDLAHIGLWGHSFGGATALAVCQQDPRCKAGVDMDGTPFGDSRNGSVAAPFLFISEDYRRGRDRDCTLLRQAYLNAQPGAAYMLEVTGAGHFNFSDLPYRQMVIIRPLFTLAGYTGPIAPRRALEITTAYLAAFFDHYLKDGPVGILAGPGADYPEVTFEKR